MSSNPPNFSSRFFNERTTAGSLSSACEREYPSNESPHKRLQEIKERFLKKISSDEPFYSCTRLREGFPKAGLSEFSGPLGSGKTELILDFLAENSSVRSVWIESQWSLYPVALMQRRCSLENVLFISGMDHSLWAAQQALRSGAAPIVILSYTGIPEIDLRRLQIAANSSKVALLLLSDFPTQQGSWTLARQYLIRRNAWGDVECLQKHSKIHA